MRNVTVYTKNSDKFRRIELILRSVATCTQRTEPIDIGGVAIIDTTDKSFSSLRGIRISDAPISHEHLIESVESYIETHEKRIVLNKSAREVTLDGHTAALTEVELRLFNELFDCPGYKTREELAQSVWGGMHDVGVVNVYIHYLREKLEKNGTRVILSSRKLGYGIDEKYERSTVC